MKQKYYVAKDKNGTIHFSNIKPMKPSEWQPDNPNANNEIFWIPPQYQSRGEVFFITWDNEIEGLTFENSPKEIKLILV